MQRKSPSLLILQPHTPPAQRHNYNLFCVPSRTILHLQGISHLLKQKDSTIQSASFCTLPLVAFFFFTYSILEIILYQYTEWLCSYLWLHSILLPAWATVHSTRPLSLNISFISKLLLLETKLQWLSLHIGFHSCGYKCRRNSWQWNCCIEGLMHPGRYCSVGFIPTRSPTRNVWECLSPHTYTHIVSDHTFPNFASLLIEKWLLGVNLHLSFEWGWTSCHMFWSHLYFLWTVCINNLPIFLLGGWSYLLVGLYTSNALPLCPHDRLWNFFF